MTSSQRAWLLCSFTLACAACGGSSEVSIDEGDAAPGTTDDAGDSGTPPGDDDAGSTGDDAAPATGDDAGSGDASPGDDGGAATSDGGLDAGMDATVPSSDAGVDGATGDDAGIDSGTLPDATTAPDAAAGDDAGMDAGTDAGVDAGKDDAGNGVDAGLDAGFDAGTDAGFDAGADAGPPVSEELAVTTTGFGIVTASGSALSCPSSCTATYPKGTLVTLTANPSDNQTFTAWGGACSGSAPTCDVTLDAATKVSAAFSRMFPTATPVDATFDCTIAVKTYKDPITLAVVITGATPTNVPPGVAFGMADFQISATIPAAFATFLTSAGYTSVSGEATTVDVASDAVNNTTVNAAAGAAATFAFGPTTLTTGEATTIKLPAMATRIGTWTAVSSGTMDFTAGALDMNLSFTGTKGALGSPLAATVTCTAPTPAVTVSRTSVP